MREIITSKRRKAHLDGGGVTAREYISKTVSSTDYIAFVFKGIDKERVPERVGLLLEDRRLYFVAHDDGFSPHNENGSATSAVINVSKSRLGDVDKFLGDYKGLEYDEERFSFYIDCGHKIMPREEDDNNEVIRILPELIDLGDREALKKLEVIKEALLNVIDIVEARRGCGNDIDRD